MYPNGERTAEGYRILNDKLRQAWDQGHIKKPLGQPAIELVAALTARVPSGARVLDAGCGRGRNTFALSDAGFDVYGCDFSQAAIGIAFGRARLQGAAPSFMVAELANLPYRQNVFAAVLCTHVLPYFYRHDIYRALGELRCVLLPGGWIYFDLLACDDAEFGCAPELEPGTFIGEEGVPQHFSSRQEVVDLSTVFSQVKIERLELGTPSKRRVAWAVWARR
ncbi:class I SAM-dependent methyltransferase [Chloroflexota bacterium]